MTYANHRALEAIAYSDQGAEERDAIALAQRLGFYTEPMLEMPARIISGMISEGKRIRRMHNALRELLIAVTYAAPPRHFGAEGDEPNLCFEARVPVEFVEIAERAFDAYASVDTHPEGGDVEQAPSLMGSAVPQADAQNKP